MEVNIRSDLVKPRLNHIFACPTWQNITKIACALQSQGSASMKTSFDEIKAKKGNLIVNQ